MRPIVERLKGSFLLRICHTEHKVICDFRPQYRRVVCCVRYIYRYILGNKNGTSVSSRLYCSDICRQCMIDCLFRSVLRHHLSGCAKGMNISHSCCHSGIAIFGDGYPIPCDPVICERVQRTFRTYRYRT